MHVVVASRNILSLFFTCYNSDCSSLLFQNIRMCIHCVVYLVVTFCRMFISDSHMFTATGCYNLVYDSCFFTCGVSTISSQCNLLGYIDSHL